MTSTVFLINCQCNLIFYHHIVLNFQVNKWLNVVFSKLNWKMMKFTYVIKNKHILIKTIQNCLHNLFSIKTFHKVCLITNSNCCLIYNSPTQTQSFHEVLKYLSTTVSIFRTACILEDLSEMEAIWFPREKKREKFPAVNKGILRVVNKID